MEKTLSFVKELMKNIGLILGALLLVVVAVAIFIPLTFVSLGWKVYVSVKGEDKRKARDIMKGVAAYFLAVAVGIDKFANMAFGGLFNALLLRDGDFKFGDSSDTISEVMGWAHYYDDLTRLGKGLRTFVNWVDFTVEDHCEDARLHAIERANEKLARVMEVYE